MIIGTVFPRPLSREQITQVLNYIGTTAEESVALVSLGRLSCLLASLTCNYRRPRLGLVFVPGLIGFSGAVYSVLLLGVYKHRNGFLFRFC